MPLPQSVAPAHVFPIPHRPQMGPPQSTSVSAAFFIPSVQLGGAGVRSGIPIMERSGTTGMERSGITGIERSGTAIFDERSGIAGIERSGTAIIERSGIAGIERSGGVD